METFSARKRSVVASLPSDPAPPAGLLAECDEGELLAVIRSAPRGSARRAAACDLLVSSHRPLVWSCVRRYRGNPDWAEDLLQVGYVGLVKAINNFDPAVGVSLAAYAQPCITGEIKRYFRDKRWQVHVRRSVQELVLQVREAASELTHRLGRVPAEAELARHLGVSDSDLREARRADLAFRAFSLDTPLSGHPGAATIADMIGAEDSGYETALGMQSVATHWNELPGREQRVLLMRFFGDMTQSDIGQQLGISQMHVSRLQAHALGHLRTRLLGSDEAQSQAA